MFTWECTLQAGKLDQPHDDIIETVLMKTMNRETPQLGNRFIFVEIHLLFKLLVVLRQGVLGRGRIWAYEGIAWWLPWVLLGFTKPFAKPYKFRNHQCQQPARTRNSGKSNFDIFKTKQNKLASPLEQIHLESWVECLFFVFSWFTAVVAHSLQNSGTKHSRTWLKVCKWMHSKVPKSQWQNIFRVQACKNGCRSRSNRRPVYYGCRR